MKGKYKLIVSNNKIKYNLSFKRGITIIKGESATGKTELMRLIQMYQRNGASSGVKVDCDVPCQAIWRSLEDAISVIRSAKNEILFFDETDRFVLTQEFASAVKGCDCYIVIINRETLDNLAYSVREIKKLVCRKGTVTYENDLEEMYSQVGSMDEISPCLVISEDRNSGYEMFSMIYSCRCISADGNSNVCKVLERAQEPNDILVIVDGAAFGAQYERIRGVIEIKQQKVVLWMPESFEWLILKSDIISGVKEKLINDTELYADTKDFLTWERFYTYLLEDITKNDMDYKYSKSKLSLGYRLNSSIRKFKSVIPEFIRPF